MTRNVGNVDRWLRVIAGVVLLALVVVLESNARWLGLIGLVPLLTGIAGTCPAYSLFGIRTGKVGHRTA
ncbi:MAG TPA: DUF2892 domain-containing protein [Geminicoccaceae bacterium]